MQLNKFLAHAGVCSRRNAVSLIESGQVRVNTALIKEPYYQVAPEDRVYIADRPVKLERKYYVLLNKPKDCVTTLSDELGRCTVRDIIGPKIKERIYPVGRLDRGTTGVLILTNDGALAQKLAHPRSNVQKVYHVVLDRFFEHTDLANLRRGIKLEDGFIKPDNVGYTKDKSRAHVSITLHSGKNRVVRRVFEKMGYKVIKLDRICFAGLTKRGLPVGAWRFLEAHEIAMLQKA